MTRELKQNEAMARVKMILMFPGGATSLHALDSKTASVLFLSASKLASARVKSFDGGNGTRACDLPQKKLHMSRFQSVSVSEC